MRKINFFCKEKHTISFVLQSRALYTLPQVPSPSSSKILYLEKRIQIAKNYKNKNCEPFDFRQFNAFESN